jgi:hypothetical protein
VILQVDVAKKSIWCCEMCDIIQLIVFVANFMHLNLFFIVVSMKGEVIIILLAISNISECNLLGKLLFIPTCLKYLHSITTRVSYCIFSPPSANMIKAIKDAMDRHNVFSILGLAIFTNFAMKF